VLAVPTSFALFVRRSNRVSRTSLPIRLTFSSLTNRRYYNSRSGFSLANSTPTNWRNVMTTITKKTIRRKRHPARTLVKQQAANTPYRVGPGFPPREHQFQPGRSGNPEGARKKRPSIAPDLKALLQAALSKKLTLTIGDKERILTKAAAGIEQLVDQFARGDRYARRDLFDLADKLGLDLGASSKAALEELAGKALMADDEALVADFLKRNIPEPEANTGAPSLGKMQENISKIGDSHEND
jgi:hypothetical protein